MKSNISRLRMLAFLEGTSLLLLVFVAIPVKYILKEPVLVKIIGPVHGGLFLLFVLGTMSTAIEHNWKFSKITWKVLIACFIPFGTFYIDRTVLRKLSAD